ncbi:MAG TPA: hypothetical protein VFI47_19220 [Acidimicrobiales bacterium]|nr:hypothetical protein [Acidimicrobiales bacterium]
MPSVAERARQWWTARRCCPPPPRVTGVEAHAGGGSGEVVVTWDPLPASAGVSFYRVYEGKGPGLWWHLAVVTDAALGQIEPGRLGIVDAADFWPWPSAGTGGGSRCYVVTAVSTGGLEGPLSAEACGSPP